MFDAECQVEKLTMEQFWYFHCNIKFHIKRRHKGFLFTSIHFEEIIGSHITLLIIMQCNV